jgi:hypothetical protein
VTAELRLMLQCKHCAKITDPSKWRVAPDTEQDGICPYCNQINRAADGAISVMTNVECEAPNAPIIPAPVAASPVRFAPCEDDYVYNTFAPGTPSSCRVCHNVIPDWRRAMPIDTCSVACDLV